MESEKISFCYRMKHGSTILVAGAGNSGKTFFLIDLMKNKDKVFDKQIDKIIYVYNSNYQPVFDEYKKSHFDAVFVPTVEEAEGEIETGKNCFIIFDDQMLRLENDRNFNTYISDFWIQRAHHCNLTVCLVSQNLYSKALRSIFLNTTYLVVFKMVRDKSQLQYLNRQYMPGARTFLISSMDIATKDNPHKYLLFDFNSCTPDRFRLRNFVYPILDMKIFIPLENDNNNSE